MSDGRGDDCVRVGLAVAVLVMEWTKPWISTPYIDI